MKALTNSVFIICCIIISLILGFTPLTTNSNQNISVKIKKKINIYDYDKNLNFIEIKKPNKEMLESINKLNKDIKDLNISINSFKHYNFFSYKDSLYKKNNLNNFVKIK